MALMNRSEGFLAIPMGLVLAALTLAAIGIWGFLHDWRRLAEHQLRLDRCVAEQTLELRSQLEAVDRSNLRMKALRAGVLAGTLAPAAAAALREALEAEALLQEAARIRWNAARVSWLVRRGCGDGDDPLPLPPFPYLREPPDPLGPRPLRWIGGPGLFVQSSHPPRYSAARLENRDWGGIDGKWKASWAAPKRMFRPDLR